MRIPLQVNWRDIDPSPAIESEIRRHVDKLESYFDRITGVRVTLEQPHRHHHRGRLFHVTIDLTLPGHEIVTRRVPPQRHSHEDFHVALRDAFDAARQRLQDLVRLRAPQVRRHHANPEGLVAALFPSDGYGFIRTRDGRDIYFNRNSVIGAAFDEIEKGDVVTFAEEPGEDGPQASTVRVARKRSRAHHASG